MQTTKTKPRQSLNPYFDKKFWHRTHNRKKNEPLLGSCTVVGKDIQGRKIILPSGFREQTGRKVTLAVAKQIVSDYMDVVNERLLPYRFRQRAKRN